MEHDGLFARDYKMSPDDEETYIVQATAEADR